MIALGAFCAGFVAGVCTIVALAAGVNWLVDRILP